MLMINRYIPVELGRVAHVNANERAKGLRSIFFQADIVGNIFYKDLLKDLENKDFAWPPLWLDDVIAAIKSIYDISNKLQKNWACGSFCKEQPPCVSGIELEYIVAHESILENEEFQEKFLKRAQQIPTAYLAKKLECVFYDAETKNCQIAQSMPLICRLQNQKIDRQWEELFDLFYYIVDQGNTLDASLLYGSLFTHFLINYYYVFPILNEGVEGSQDQKILYNKVYKNLEKNDIKQSWMNLNFQAHNYILNLDKNISRLYNKTQVKRNDICPCGSGKKYKHCCIS